jgi:2,3,4,5-tetrahydropyridine-2,6-dicarboxylate N-succinyltransferase
MSGSLEERIDAAWDEFSTDAAPAAEFGELLAEFRAALNAGSIRVAAPEGDSSDARQRWVINLWVKRGLLLHQALGRLSSLPEAAGCFELDTLPRRRFNAHSNVRVPSEACYVRDGVYVAANVTLLPPCFVGVGAWIDEGTLIDSHCSVGVCAQIGKQVRVSAGALIGGLLQPFDALPNIVCDDVTLGSHCSIADGVYVGEGAVVAAGVHITRDSRIFDPAKQACYKAAPGQCLVIPPMAIVVAGAQPVMKGSMANTGLLVNSLIVAGYRGDSDLGTDIYGALIE